MRATIQELFEVVFLTERPQWKISENRMTDLGTRNRTWNILTHGKGGPRTLLYEEPL
jgi:hypothetical protein